MSDDKKVECPPELKDRLAKMRKSLPARERFFEDQRRLIDLAKQAPFASANRDFLELQEVKLKGDLSEHELAKMISGIMD